MDVSLVWLLGDAAEVRRLDGWMVEALIDLDHLRAQPVGSRLDLRLKRIEHARACTESRGFPWPQRTILPVCAWRLSIEGLREWGIDVSDEEVELMVKKTAGGAQELRIEGVVGRLILVGSAMRVEARLMGDSDLEVVRTLGVQSFRRRSDRT